jgi:YegS/Rv2252/BmrU family lipid kinase
LTDKRKILIVINPAAGKAVYQKQFHYLENKLKEADLDFSHFFTEPNSKGALKKILKENPQINEVIVVGGDGTLNYVVNELYGSGLPISIVSNGTGNDTVKSLHGEMKLEKQVEIAIKGKISKFDLGLCNETYFVNGFGIGFDGLVVKKMVEKGNKKRSHMDYLLTVLRIVGGFKEKLIRFSIDEKPYEKKILLMTISNGTTFGGGFVINPFAKTNDGLLDVCILNEVSPMMRFWHLPKLKTGAHYKIRQSEFYLAKQISIKSNDLLVAHIDGEYIGYPPFEISVIKEGLSLRTPA